MKPPKKKKDLNTTASESFFCWIAMNNAVIRANERESLIYNQGIDDMNKWIDESPIWETLCSSWSFDAGINRNERFRVCSEAIRKLLKGGGK